MKNPLSAKAARDWPQTEQESKLGENGIETRRSAPQRWAEIRGGRREQQVHRDALDPVQGVATEPEIAFEAPDPRFAGGAAPKPSPGLAPGVVGYAVRVRRGRSV